MERVCLRTNSLQLLCNEWGVRSGNVTHLCLKLQLKFSLLTGYFSWYSKGFRSDSRKNQFGFITPLSVRLQSQYIFVRNKVPPNSLDLMTKEVTERSNFTVAILKHAEQEMSSSKSSEMFWIKFAEKLHARLAHPMIMSVNEEMPKGGRKL